MAEDPLKLPADTLALLQEFYQEQNEREKTFKKLEQEAEERFQNDRAITVDSFRHAFEEDWQLSQFWYSEEFSLKFARFVRQQLAGAFESKHVAYLCCPTAYAGLRQLEDELSVPRRANAKILEVDTRFKVLAGDDYVYYDLNNPEDVPESLKGSIDLAIIDPPFLNEVTEAKVHETLQLICKDGAGLIILTSTSVKQIIERMYSTSRLGPIRQLEVPVEHGRGLQNEFAIWANNAVSDPVKGSW